MKCTMRCDKMLNNGLTCNEQCTRTHDDKSKSPVIVHVCRAGHAFY